MYYSLRSYSVKPDSSTEVIERIEEGFVPLLRGMPGFLDYYVLEGQEGAITTMTFCEDRAGAERSAGLEADWLRQNLPTLLPNTYETPSSRIIFAAGPLSVESERPS